MLFCMGCFAQIDDDVKFCPVCGYNEAAQGESLYHLPPRTVLAGKYMVGRVLGEGGFGITYIGYDLNLDIKVAIKEYYPTGLVMRSTTVSMSVQPLGGDQGEHFAKGRERFVDEAKRLALFRALSGIVMVSDFFVENGTAYIVMEYIEGQTLKSYLSQVGGKLQAERVFEMLTPVFGSLAQVHENGIIHRDISPDNIMITHEGSMKLLDFGAAREFGEDGNKSLSVMLKHGYAPVEQYTTKGRQGPHTDVYALSATIYRAITGVTPEGSMDRSIEDSLLPPTALGITMPSHQEAALMKGLAVRVEERFKTVAELHDALVGVDGNRPAPVRPSPSPSPNKNKIIAATVAAVVVVVAIVLALTLPDSPNGGGDRANTPSGSIFGDGGETTTRPAGTPVNDTNTPPADSGISDEKDKLREIIENYYEWIHKYEISADYIVNEDEHSVRIILADSMFFDSGSATMRPDAFPTLDRLIELFFGIELLYSELKIESHTDNRPIHTALFSSNYEFSLARAHSVYEYLLEDNRLGRVARLGYMGYGDTMPIASNDTEDNMARNRRIEFVILVELGNGNDQPPPTASYAPDSETSNQASIKVQSVEITYAGFPVTDCSEYVGSSIPLRVSIEPTGAVLVEDIVWVSSDPSVFEVVKENTEGTAVTVTLISTGAATLTVSVDGVNAECTIRGMR